MAAVGTASKAEAFCEDAKAMGWDPELTLDGDKSTVIATRGDEQVSISWRKEACLNESTYTFSGRTRKLRNASAVRQQMAKPVPGTDKAAGESAPKSRRASGSATKKARSGKTKEPPPPPFRSTPKPATRLPFDLEKASDEEVLKAVLGKRIVWKNRMSGNFDEARVMDRPDQRFLRIDINARNERCLTFAEADAHRADRAGGGFRSVRLSAIISITTK